MFDVIIKNARIVDGSGEKPFCADIALRNGKIAAVGAVEGETAGQFDAGGLTLAPGFIDVHGHSDLFAFLDPLRASKLEQGITAEICGQCGLGPAPVSEPFAPQYEGYMKSLGAPVYPNYKELSTFGAYLRYMQSLSMGVHLAYFIPHGIVRIAVMGLSPEAPSSAQLARMAEMVEEGMAGGALGLSSGLMYAPGSFAGRAEFDALCRVVGKYGGIYTSHLRNQGELLEECVQETVDIARQAGCRANISHHKASGKSNWGKVRATCRIIREAGIPVTHDVYPYAASSTTISSTLPPQYLKMPVDDLLAFLKEKRNHAALENAIFRPTELFENPLPECGYEGILIINAPGTPCPVQSAATTTDLFPCFAAQ